MITLETELLKIRGLSPAFIAKLGKLEISTVKDLLWHFPYRYEDFSRIVKIGDLMINQSATIQGVIKKIDLRRTWRRKMLLVEAVIVDESGGLKAVWFNQPYIAKILKPGTYANFAGRLVSGDEGVYLSNPIYEPLRGSVDIKHTAGLIPIYPETRGLTSRGLRYLIKPILGVLPPITDFIPKEILLKNRLPGIDLALKNIHFPSKLAHAEEARRRFAFEDLFLLQLNNLKLRSALAKEKSPPLKFTESELKEILKTLPFELTNPQKRSLEEILSDLSKDKPMNRLLQGDVGSGKTVIAAIAALVAAKNDKQATFMAPTEVLARQHYQTLNKLFQEMPDGWGTKIGLLLGGLNQKIKKETIKKVALGEIKIIIGTHALIQKGVHFKNLTLIVVDEQHRFGVEQRAVLLRDPKNPNTSELSEKGELLPHFLSMSATPIPRTLSLTLFGDLDLSIIDELPKGRKPIITKVVSPLNRAKAYDFVREEIKKGRQAFVICPRIEANREAQGAMPTGRQAVPTGRQAVPTGRQAVPTGRQAVPTGRQANSTNDLRFAISAKQNAWADVKAVKEEYEKLSQKIFPDLKVAMLHGKMKSKEKEEIMSSFAKATEGKNNKIDILVSTSVIEVGVDVPNATIMIIEGAERFGLAQLYQFRGRIGRGEHQSFCLLFTESEGQSVQERLNALLKAKNGFELAELDLKIRGPGEFLGEKQTGLPDLAMRALNNMELIRTARQSAEEIIQRDAELTAYPLLREKLSAFQKIIHLE